MNRRSNLLVVLGLVLVACGGSNQPSTTTPAPSGPTAPAGEPTTGEAVLEASLAAQGGREKLAKVKSMKQTGTMTIPQMGMKGTVTIIAAPPRNSLTTIEIGGMGKVAQGVTDDIAWEHDPSSGARILKDNERAVQLRESTFNADLEWKTHYPTVVLDGVVDFNGSQAYKVTMTAKEGDVQTRFFAKDTKLPLGSTATRETQMGKIPVETVYSDYREVNGIKYPHKVVQKVGPQSLEFTINTIEQDVALPADAFALPPPVAALKK